MKLYLVSTKSFSSYVVVDSPNEAEDVLVKWMQANNYGFLNDRTVKKIELFADTSCKPNSLVYPTSQLLISESVNNDSRGKE